MQVASWFPSTTPAHLLIFALSGASLAFLRRLPWVYVMVRLPGTIFHEGAHYLVGLCLMAQPISYSVRPLRTVAGRISLGRVEFARLTWWNKIPVGLAPLLLLPVAYTFFGLASMASIHSPWALIFMALSWIFLLSAMPSLTDIFHVISSALVVATVAIAVVAILQISGVLRFWN